MEKGRKRVFQDRLYRQQKGKCAYCNTATRRAESSTQEPTTATLDHVIPLSKGGLSNWQNLVLACYSCNQRKADSFWEPRFGNTIAHRYYLSLRMIALSQATPAPVAVIISPDFALTPA